MTLQKRRIVYFTDKEWADVRQWADERGLSASGLLRDAARQMSGRVHPPKDQIDVAIARVEAKQSWNPAPKPSQKGKAK